MKKIFSKNVLLSSFCFLIIGVFVFFGCEKEEDQPLDEDIINSPELEEYIIAGADFQQSLAAFTAGLSKIDFSTLEITYDAEGRKIVHLPSAVVGSIRIEEKVYSFNEKKEALQKKYPQFASFREDVGKKYFKHSIQNSVNVKGAFLRLGIITSRTLLKNGNVESWYGDEDLVFLHSYLYNWINSSSYVELWIIYYADGTFSIYQHPQATASWSSITWQVDIYGNYYFPQGGSSSHVVSVGHTHQYSSNPTQPYYDQYGNYKSGDYYHVPSGVDRFIYYNWGYYYY